MRVSFSLRNISFGLAIASLVSAGAASAQSLSSVNARLVKPLESKTATVGEAVAVTLDGTVKTADGVKLPKGTELLGKVAAVQASEKGGPSSVSLVFTEAQLKGGKQLPVKATLIGAFPADQDADQDSDASLAPLSKQVAPDQSFDQEPGALPGVSLKASVQNPDSGTFAKADGDFKLSAGTFLQLGVAPTSAGSTTAAAE